jgi:hypothetical protein
MNSDAGRVACLAEAAAAKAGVGYPYFCPGLQIGRPYKRLKPVISLPLPGEMMHVFPTGKGFRAASI